MNNEFNISDDIKNIELIQEYNQILLNNKKTNENLFELFVFDTDGDNMRIKKDNIYNLKFGDDFLHAQKIEKDVLPNSLTHLTFGNSFNQVIEKDVVMEKDVLPNSLTHLVLPNSYEHDITHLSKDIKIEYFNY